jgi:hypothetical protein
MGPIDHQRSKSPKTGRNFVLINVRGKATNKDFPGESFSVGIETGRLTSWRRPRRIEESGIVGVKSRLVTEFIAAAKGHHAFA